MRSDYLKAEEIIENLGMKPQEEGGLVRENHYPFSGPGRAASGQAYYYFRPNVSTQFHTLDCDEYWVYHAGRDLEVWIIDPQGRKRILRFGSSKEAVLTVYLPKGVAFAAKPVGVAETGTLISAITVPRFSNDGIHLLEPEEVIRMCPEAKAFFE